MNTISLTINNDNAKLYDYNESDDDEEDELCSDIDEEATESRGPNCQVLLIFKIKSFSQINWKCQEVKGLVSWNFIEKCRECFSLLDSSKIFLAYLLKKLNFF